VGADVGLLHPALVGADVVGHAVLPLEALLADGTGVGLLVGVGEPVAVQVVHVPECLPTRLTCMVLPHRAGVGRALGWTDRWTGGKIGRRVGEEDLLTVKSVQFITTGLLKYTCKTTQALG